MTSSIKTRPSKTKCLIWMFIPITHSIIYYYQKVKKVFCDANVIEDPEATECPLRVLFRFHGDRVLVRFLKDKVLLRVLRDMILCESSVIGSYSGSPVIDFFLGSSVLFFRHVTIFYQTFYYFFINNRMLCFTVLYFQKELHT